MRVLGGEDDAEASGACGGGVDAGADVARGGEVDDEADRASGGAVDEGARAHGGDGDAGAEGVSRGVAEGRRRLLGFKRSASRAREVAEVETDQGREAGVC
eukprot:IDg7872t1